MRKGGAHEGLQRNVSNGFDAAMRRLEAVYGATEGDAPAGFEELINYWHSACGLSDAARHDLHVLRIWRNASDHHDSDRWRRDGPRSDGEAMALLERIGAAVDTGNSFALLDDPYDAIEALAPFAFSVHLKDQALREDADGFLLGDIPLGQGSFDLKRMVEILQRAKPDVRM